MITATKIKTAQPKYKKGYLILGLLAAIILAPVIAAWSLYTSGRGFTEETVNYGHLIIPPPSLRQLPLLDSSEQPLPLSVLRGKWWFTLIAPEGCNRLCESALQNLHNIHRALGKDAPRVQEMLIAYPQAEKELIPISKEYPAVMINFVTPATLTQFLTPLTSKSATLQQGYLYLVDPLGNVMMSYPLGANPRGILADIERLLRYSKIG